MSDQGIGELSSPTRWPLDAKLILEFSYSPGVSLDELTPYVAHELIKAIYVGAPDKSSGKRRQSIHIEYDLIGFIPLNELMKQETA